MWSHVKEIDMVITLVVWSAVVGLKYDKMKVTKGTIEDFNKVKFYKTCLRNLTTEMRGLLVRKLAMNSRILAFITAWILTPRGSNHVVLTKDDLMLMYCLIYKIKVNWVYVMKEHMIKSKDC